MGSTGKAGSKSPLCVLCFYPMTNGGYLRQAGKPVTYIPVNYCINTECPRYGLLAILKQANTGEQS